MTLRLRMLAATAGLLAASLAGGEAWGQKSGGDSQDLSPRQPGQHVDPRGGDFRSSCR